MILVVLDGEKQSQTNPINVSPRYGRGFETNLKKQSQITPKGVERRPGDDCNRDIVVCEQKIWYKTYVTRSTGIC